MIIRISLFLFIFSIAAFASAETKDTVVSGNLKHCLTFTSINDVGYPKGFHGIGISFIPNTDFYFSVSEDYKGYAVYLFDKSGMLRDSLYTKENIISVWYNSSQEFAEILFDNSVIRSYKINSDGKIVFNNERIINLEFPENAYPCFEPVSNSFIMIDFSNRALGFYDYETGNKTKTIELSDLSEKNFRQLNKKIAFTGYEHREIALLNYVTREIYLLDISSGKLSAKMKLPFEGLQFSELSFDTSNGKIWIFQGWAGVKIWDAFCSH